MERQSVRDCSNIHKFYSQNKLVEINLHSSKFNNNNNNNNINTFSAV